MSHHTLVHRALGPVVHGLATLQVTPDQLTLLRLLTGVGAALCLAQGEAELDVGAGLFLLSALLDRLDGALARRTGRFSSLGGRFDLIADCLSTMGFFVGLGFGFRAALIPDPTPSALAWSVSAMLGLSAAVSVALLFLQLAQARREADSDLVRPFDPDDVMILLPCLLWLGFGGAVLLAAGIISPITAAALWWADRRRRAVV